MSDADGSTRERAHVLVRGRVQGVGYREFTRRSAVDLGLGGWVRNRRDGSVETCLEGAPSKVEEALSRLRRGPRFAEVDALEFVSRAPQPADEPELPVPFEVRR